MAAEHRDLLARRRSRRCLGEKFVQTDLANSIQYMADQERAAAGDRAAGLRAARDAFYRGDIARRDRRLPQAERRLAARATTWPSSMSISKRRWRVRFGDSHGDQLRPVVPGAGAAANLAHPRRHRPQGAGPQHPAYIHTLIEALKLAFADRHAYYGDPKFVDVPIDALLSDAYTAMRQARIDPARAWPEMPPAGTPAELGLTPRGLPGATADKEYAEPEPDTSYICVVDRHGNAFSATPSDGALNTPVIPGTGIAPSSRGMQSWTDPAHPACLAPGKRPRLTPNPAIARRQGKWTMPFGTPGNDVQPQAMLQVFLNMAVFDMAPQQAIEQPRFASSSFPGSSDPHTYTPAAHEHGAAVHRRNRRGAGPSGPRRKLVARMGVEGRMRLRGGEEPRDRDAGGRRRCAPAGRSARVVVAAAGRDIEGRPA